MRRALSGFLKQARVDAGFKKQRDLAARTGLSQQQISAWEAGKRVVPPKHARVLAVALKVPEVDLLRLIGDAQAEETATIRKQSLMVSNDRELLLTKLAQVAMFVDQYEALGHTYRAMSDDVTWLVAQVSPLLESLHQISERLARLEQRLPPPELPPPTPIR